MRIQIIENNLSDYVALKTLLEGIGQIVIETGPYSSSTEEDNISKEDVSKRICNTVLGKIDETDLIFCDLILRNEDDNSNSLTLFSVEVMKYILDYKTNGELKVCFITGARTISDLDFSNYSGVVDNWIFLLKPKIINNAFDDKGIYLGCPYYYSSKCKDADSPAKSCNKLECFNKKISSLVGV